MGFAHSREESSRSAREGQIAGAIVGRIPKEIQHIIHRGLTEKWIRQATAFLLGSSFTCGVHN